MKKLLLLLCLFDCFQAFSQDHKDTAFNVRGFTCSCKYNIDPNDDKGIFDLKGQPAYYPGGEEEWKKFVKKNLDKGFKGKHEVRVRFLVDKNGGLSGFTLLNKAPDQKYEEVLRILRLSGKWFPSVQDGFCIKSYVSMVFEL
jgi:hypothetical protein